ncbi:MAG: DUF1854 domain-containing protein [Planctomycetia bacterium]
MTDHAASSDNGTAPPPSTGSTPPAAASAEALRAMKLERDALGRLVVVDAVGKRWVGVDPVRAFPLSDPNHFISLVDDDGSEIVCIADLADLAPDARWLLEAELTDREFLPIIRRIVSLVRGVEPPAWRVDTDRGPAVLELKGEESLRKLAGDQVLIHDRHGVRYLVPSIGQLDAYSRRVLDRYV